MGINHSARTKIIKLSDENVGLNHRDLGVGNDFLDVIAKAQVTKEQVDNRTSSKLKEALLQQ